MERGRRKCGEENVNRLSVFSPASSFLDCQCSGKNHSNRVFTFAYFEKGLGWLGE